MWIGEANYNLLVQKTVDNLLNLNSGMSYTLVVPPGFGESFVPAEIAAQLKAAEPSPLVAHLKLDSLRNTHDFYSEVDQQWSGDKPKTNFQSLGELLKKYRTDPRQKLLVISRFHKILDVIDATILRDLREAEQASQIKTAIASIYPLDWIKAEWVKSGNKLLASNYGDMHSPRVISPVDPKECFNHFKNYKDEKIPSDVIQFGLSLTGGVPQHLTFMVDLWKDKGRPDIGKQSVTALREICESKANTIAKYLDDTGNSRFRDLIVDIHEPPMNESSHIQFAKVHPWANWLLDESGLRSEALGECCVSNKIKDAIEGTSDGDTIEIAYEAYSKNQFQSVKELLGGCIKQVPLNSVKLLWNHANIMDSIFDRGIDADWKNVKQVVQNAKPEVQNLDLSARDVRRLEAKYDQLDGLAEAVLSAGKHGNRKVVDELAGSGNETTQHEAAMTLLVLQLACAKSSRGNSESILKCISMPEQIYRVWANWALNLDFDQIPDARESVWQLVEEKFKEVSGNKLNRPQPGTSFPGFAIFCFFAVAMLQEEEKEKQERSPLSSFAELKKVQYIFDFRNAPAHATVTSDAKGRKKYTELIENWLEKLCTWVPGNSLTMDEISSRIEPLPILDRITGRLDWH